MSSGENPLPPIASHPRRFFELRLPQLFPVPAQEKGERHGGRCQGVDQTTPDEIARNCFISIIATQVAEIPTPHSSRPSRLYDLNR